MYIQLLIKRTLFILACLLGMALQGSGTKSMAYDAQVEQDRKAMRDRTRQREEQALSDFKYEFEQLVNGQPARKNALLQNACLHGRTEFVEYLLKRGANPHSAFTHLLLYGNNAISAQEIENQKKIMQFLLNAGACPESSLDKQLLSEQPQIEEMVNRHLTQRKAYAETIYDIMKVCQIPVDQAMLLVPPKTKVIVSVPKKPKLDFTQPFSLFAFHEESPHASSSASSASSSSNSSLTQSMGQLSLSQAHHDEQAMLRAKASGKFCSASQCSCGQKKCSMAPIAAPTFPPAVTQGNQRSAFYSTMRRLPVIKEG